MPPNFLAQFSGPKPDPVMWGLEIREIGESPIVTVYMMESFLQSPGITGKVRKLHPTADIRVTAQHLG